MMFLNIGLLDLLEKDVDLSCCSAEPCGGRSRDILEFMLKLAENHGG
jgi:hypothetical protein